MIYSLILACVLAVSPVGAEPKGVQPPEEGGWRRQEQNRDPKFKWKD